MEYLLQRSTNPHLVSHRSILQKLRFVVVKLRIGPDQMETFHALTDLNGNVSIIILYNPRLQLQFAAQIICPVRYVRDKDTKIPYSEKGMYFPRGAKEKSTPSVACPPTP